MLPYSLSESFGLYICPLDSCNHLTCRYILVNALAVCSILFWLRIKSRKENMLLLREYYCCLEENKFLQEMLSDNSLKKYFLLIYVSDDF